MSAKVYKAQTLLSVPLVVDGKIRKYIQFKDEKNTYRTSDPVIQEALEALPIFGKSFKLQEEIKGKNDVPAAEKPKDVVAHTVKETPCPGVADTSTASAESVSDETDNAPEVTDEVQETKSNVFPDVSDWQSAKEILRKEYSVAHQSLGTPDKIAAKAQELGVSFPNLK